MTGNPQQLDPNKVTKPVDSTENQKDGHREIVFSVTPGEKQFWLKIQDTRHTWNNIPLGRVSSTPKGKHPKGSNVLVPVIPLCYTTATDDAEADKLKAAIPRPGWLYVYRNGTLWRELEVGASGYMRDVNLQYTQNMDVREATGYFDNRVLLPFKVQGEIQTLEMAFSEVQWSWARINKIQEDAALRQQRMQEIDLSGYGTKFEPKLPEGNKARVENVEYAPELYHLALQRKSNIPAVYLHDPLGVADRLVNDVAIAEGGLISELQRAQNLETVADEAIRKLPEDEKRTFFWAAVLTYRTYFEPANAFRPIASNGSEVTSTLHCHTQGGFKTDIGLGKENLDRGYLEEILAVTTRREKRAEIRELKALLVDYLDGRYGEQSIRSEHPDYVDVHAALHDYACLEGPTYILLWGRLNSLTRFFNHDPTVIDATHDIPAEVAAERPAPENDPGYRYLEGLLDPGHPLHTALFPSAEQINVYIADMDLDPSNNKQPEPVDGSGAFRPVAFAGSVVAARKIGTYRMAADLIKEAEKITADFVASFQKHWERACAGKTVAEVDAVFRLTKAADLPELKGLHIVAPGNTLDGKVVIDARVRVMKNLGRAQRRALAAGSKSKPSKGIDIVDPRTDKVLGSQELAQVGRYHGAVREIAEADWTELWGETGKVGNETKLVRTRAKLVVVPETSPYAIKYHNPELVARPGVVGSTRMLRGMSKTLPPLVAVIEGWNLKQAFFNPDPSASALKKGANVFVAGAALTYATVDAAIKIFGEKTVLDNLGQFGQRMLTAKVNIAGEKVPIYSARGASLGAGVISGLSAIMAGWEAFGSLQREDYDAGGAYTVSAGGFAGSALAALGGEGGIAALSFLGPWGMVFFGVGIGAGLIALTLTDTELEKWAKHGPFSKDVADRMTHDYEVLSSKGALEKLLDLFMRPRITISEDISRTHTDSMGNRFSDVVVEVVAPGFEPGPGTLHIHATMESAGIDVRGISPGQPVFTGQKQTQQEPYRIEPIYANEHSLDQIGVRYRYTGLTGRWRARAQHVTSEQIVLPPPPKENKGYDPVKITEIDPGWVSTMKDVAGRS